MDFHTESGDTKRVVCITKQRYKLFQKVNESKTEGVIIKKARIENDNILITDFTNVNTS